MDLARIVIKVAVRSRWQDETISATGDDRERPSVTCSRRPGTGEAGRRRAQRGRGRGWSSGWRPSRFADTDWDGIATIKVDLPRRSASQPRQSASQATRGTLDHAAAIGEDRAALHRRSSTSRLRPDLTRYSSASVCRLPRPRIRPHKTSGSRTRWRLGTRRSPGNHRCTWMKAQRPNASDNVAITLLAPNFGYISIGSPRQPASEEGPLDGLDGRPRGHPSPARVSPRTDLLRQEVIGRHSTPPS